MKSGAESGRSTPLPRGKIIQFAVGRVQSYGCCGGEEGGDSIAYQLMN